MSDSDSDTDNTLAFIMGAGAAALGVTLAAAAITNTQWNTPATRRSRQNNSGTGWGQVFGAIGSIAAGAQENEPSTSRSRQNDNNLGIGWGEVVGTIGSVAGAVVAGAAQGMLAKVATNVLCGQPSRKSPPSEFPRSSAAEEREQENGCGICSQALWGGYKELSCKHKFHTVCIRKWKEISKRCPTCGSLVLL